MGLGQKPIQLWDYEKIFKTSKTRKTAKKIKIEGKKGQETCPASWMGH